MVSLSFSDPDVLWDWNLQLTDLVLGSHTADIQMFEVEKQKTAELRGARVFLQC